jgi:hypothetical protein
MIVYPVSTAYESTTIIERRNPCPNNGQTWHIVHHQCASDSLTTTYLTTKTGSMVFVLNDWRGHCSETQARELLRCAPPITL